MLRDPSVPATTSHWISHSRPVRVDEPDQRRIPVHTTDFGVLHPEPDVAAVPVSGVGEVDENIRLRVQPAGRIDQGSEVDTVASSVKAQVDAVVLVAVGVHPVADAGIDDRLDHARLQDAGPVRCLDLLSGSGVDGHIVDSTLGEQVGKHQASRARTHDADSGLNRRGHTADFSQRLLRSSRRRWTSRCRTRARARRPRGRCRSASCRRRPCAGRGGTRN